MIRKMTDSDWIRVCEIYSEAILSGIATFTRECPKYEEWDKAHLKECRYVFEEDGCVLGFAVLSPSSSREVYRGVAELSIYVDKKCCNKGIGTALLSALLSEAELCGFWTVYSVIFAVNKSSIEFHKKNGFREVGYRERIAKDRFGNWQNTVLMEKRL